MEKITVGASLFAVGVLHNLVGLAVGTEPLLEIVQDGVFAAVPDTEPWRMSIFWFEFFGLMMMLLGATWHGMERQGMAVPRWAAVSIALIGLLGVFCMPMSGFYTVFGVAGFAWVRATG